MPPTNSTGSAATGDTPAVSKTAPKPARRNWRAAWIVLAIGLAITAMAAVSLKARVEELTERAFRFHCNELQAAISGRLDDHARILLGGAALFDASDAVTREEWRIFTKRQKVATQLPGIQGIGFSLLIPQAELARHIQTSRNEGFPEYRVKPEGDREFYSSIIYLEPFSDRNLRAFGYDMFSEPVRREAMELARDTDGAAISGKVILVQETDKDVQAGTLMYVPVYRKGMPTDTVEHRRAALYGWVYSPYRMNDLMGGILGGRDLEKEHGLHFRLFDGERPSAESLLCGCCPAESEKLWSPVRFTRQESVTFNGHRWTVGFTQLGGGFFTAEYAAAWFTIAGGIVITVLLSGLVHVQASRNAEVWEARTILQAAMDNSPAGIAIADAPSGVLRYVNDAGLLIRGGDRQSVVNGVGIDQYVANWQLLHLDGQPMKADEVPLARAIRYGETCRREFIIRRAIDEDRVVAANAAPIRDDKGNVVAGIVVFVDITDRVQAEESLRLQSEELARANTEVTRFVYTVSHDLKSPLVTIKTFLGYMEKDLASNDTERMAKDMAYAHTAADKMSGLLDELLELSRVGRKVAPFAEVPLQAIVKEAMDLVAGRIAQRGVSVEVTAGPILLFGDRRRLMEVYQNLLDNAAKFMGDQPTPRVEIGAEVNDDETVLFVRDNGIGIDPRHKARLFGLFEKLNPHTEGHGMGLAMVRRIVEMHGGKIWVESDGVGKGATFRFTLAKATVTGKDTSHDQR